MSWTTDNSGRLAVTGPEVSFKQDAVGDGKANAIWSEGGSGYWELEVGWDKPGGWLGLSSEKAFDEGYKLRGLFYGGPGNLSDGNSLVVGQWGPRPRVGDKIGMRVENMPDGRTVVAFSRNGEGLGVAFDIADGAKENFRPAVSLGARGQHVRIATREMPPVKSMETSRSRGKDDLAGSWEGRCSLTLEPEDGMWRVAVRPANTLNTVVQLDGDGRAAGNLTVMSTKMMPPPELHQLEIEMKSLLSNLAKIYKDGDQVVLEDKNGKKEAFQPAVKAAHATRENIKWLNE